MSCPGEESDPEDVPPLSDGDALPIPESMSHLHNRRLVQEVLEYLSSPQFQVRDGASVAFGGVVHELPYDLASQRAAHMCCLTFPHRTLGAFPGTRYLRSYVLSQPAKRSKDGTLGFLMAGQCLCCNMQTRLLSLLVWLRCCGGGPRYSKTRSCNPCALPWLARRCFRVTSSSWIDRRM